ncbi:MAG: FG-GAP-like repeat-containing protein, partial [Planctomycetota bacterium]
MRKSVLVRSSALCAAWLLLAANGLRAEEPTEFARLMNRGKAYLENRNSAKALEACDAAVKLDPKSSPAWRNLARARLLALKHEPALDALARAAKLETESAATSYLTGLAFARLSRFEEATPHFEKAVRLDPQVATLRFQLANAYQATERHEPALEQLRETIRVDPLHAAAYYKLSSYARKAGDRQELTRLTREFLRLRKLLGDASRDAETLERCAYTWPEPAPAGAKPDRLPPGIEVRFEDVTEKVFASGDHAAATVAAVIDVDPGGRSTLFVADAQGRVALLRMSAEGAFVRTQLDAKVPPGREFSDCIVGDFHNDVPPETKYDPKIHARNDVLLAGPQGLHLLKRTGPTAFTDVTEAAGLADVESRRACWVDYEHDGDLDLLLARRSGLELWQNNGDGRFQNVTQEVGIGQTGPASDVLAADLDANVAMDVVVSLDADATLVFENQRAGRFARMTEPPGPWPAARRILADDLNNDGYPDVLLTAEKEALILIGQTAERHRIELGSVEPAAV